MPGLSRLTQTRCAAQCRAVASAGRATITKQAELGGVLPDRGVHRGSFCRSRRRPSGGGLQAAKPWEEQLRWARRKRSRGRQNARDGNFAGSWNPVGPWGEDGGRVYSTAMMTMCLDVYYRYPRVFGTR